MKNYNGFNENGTSLIDQNSDLVKPTIRFIYNLIQRSGQIIFSEIQNDYGIKINILINIKIKNSKIKNQLINFISKFSKKKKKIIIIFFRIKK